MPATPTAFFLDETWLKRYTPLSDQMDVKYLVPHIGQAQDLRIQPVLGTTLYDELMAAIVGATVSANQANLIERIRPALAYWTAYCSIPFSAVKITNNGLVRPVSATFNPASSADITMVRTELLNIAEYYTKVMNDWLCTNSSLFPSWRSGTSLVPSSGFTFRGGFYFPDDHNCGSSCNCNGDYN